MPRTEVILFKEDDGRVPLVEWLDSIPNKPQAKCVAALARLEELGHKLRRPEANYLRDDIYELRVRFRSQNYRMLYFFHGQKVAVVSHGCTKDKRVPAREIGAAIHRKERFEKAPKKHSERFEKD
ncbi:MAG: type II toxin-antitoxin system RelE/ParE family toxin [Phycisphaerae bacterium]